MRDREESEKDREESENDRKEWREREKMMHFNLMTTDLLVRISYQFLC